jgi:hypothetical protein
MATRETNVWIRQNPLDNLLVVVDCKWLRPRKVSTRIKVFENGQNSNFIVSAVNQLIIKSAKRPAGNPFHMHNTCTAAAEQCRCFACQKFFTCVEKKFHVHTAALGYTYVHTVAIWSSYGLHGTDRVNRVGCLDASRVEVGLRGCHQGPGH